MFSWFANNNKLTLSSFFSCLSDANINNNDTKI